MAKKTTTPKKPSKSDLRKSAERARQELINRLAKQGGLAHRTDAEIRETFAQFIGEARELKGEN